MNYVKIPLSRVGVIIGPKGETKKRIEELSGCKINIDSEEGIIEIKSKNENDPLKNLQLISTAKAIGRGFTPDKAVQLIEMDFTVICVLCIESWANSLECWFLSFSCFCFKVEAPKFWIR